MSAFTIFFILAFCLAATHAFHSSIATSRSPLVSIHFSNYFFGFFTSLLLHLYFFIITLLFDEYYHLFEPIHSIYYSIIH